MPGYSYLFKKEWHPQTMDNQKKLFLAEQNALEKLKKEQEAANEIAKELEMQQYEKAGDISERDARQTSLKFMYAIPQPRDGESKGSSNSYSGMGLGRGTTSLAPGEDDDMVKAFRNNLQNNKQNQLNESSKDIYKSQHTTSTDLNNNNNKQRNGNEDPSSNMNNSLYVEKQKLILKHSSLPRELGHLAGTGQNYGSEHQLVLSDDDDVGGVIQIVCVYCMLYVHIFIRIYIVLNML
jgi:hypothetical protein